MVGGFRRAVNESIGPFEDLLFPTDEQVPIFGRSSWEGVGGESESGLGRQTGPNHCLWVMPIGAVGGDELTQTAHETLDTHIRAVVSRPNSVLVWFACTAKQNFLLHAAL